jgi:hypothetical protein
MGGRLSEREIPPFGRMLKAQLKQAGMRQESFANKMNEDGYPHGLSQQDVSYLIRHKTRIYPEFFPHAQKVLGLTDEQVMDLLWAYGLAGDSGGDQSSE